MRRATLRRGGCGRCNLRILGPIHEPACECHGHRRRNRPSVDTLLRTWNTDRRPLWVRALESR